MTTVGYSDAACLTMWVLWHAPEGESLTTSEIVIAIDDMALAERQYAIGKVRETLNGRGE